jgi:hypothetical protein
MRFLRSVKGCTRLDKTRNKGIRKELGVFSMNGRISKFRQDWLQHVERMEEGQVPSRFFGMGPKEVVVDHAEIVFIEAGTGYRPKP